MVKAAGIFLVRKDGKILVGHPTGHAKDFWSIPKGKLEVGETEFQAAIRETYEETNVDLRSVELDKLYELDRVKYKHGKKCIHPFVIFESENSIIFDDLTIKCNSITPSDSKWNPNRPEFDRFAWENIDTCRKLLHDTQVRCLDAIQHLYSKSKTLV